MAQLLSYSQEKMIRYLLIFIFFCTAYSGEKITILFPASKNQIVSHPISTINGKFDGNSVATIQMLQSYQARISLDVFAKEGKERFIVEFRSIFPDEIFLTSLAIKTSWAGGLEKKKTFTYDLRDEVDIKKFWSTPALQELLSTINESKIFYIEIKLNGWKSKQINVSSKIFSLRFGTTFSFSVPLSLGNNTFYLRGFDKKGNLTASDSLKFYRYSEIGGNTSSNGFTKSEFHIASNETTCNPCHQTKFQSLSKDQSVEKECASCHNPLMKQTNVHAPTANWECIKCHDSNSEKRYQLNADYSPNVCYECHTEKQEEITKKPSVHGVVEQCNMCHDAHAADNSMFLVAPINTICKTCHEDITQKPHPIVNHPIDGRPDPYRKGKEMSCITCHNPHASDYPMLLTTPRSSLCQDCHKK